MSFLRSDSGIANQHLFHRKQFIVYVEEEPGLDPGRAIDAPFWSKILSAAFPNLTFECKPLGGKAHVRAMAERLVAHSIPNSLCAMDLDYDEIFAETLRNERVFYTYGYGVENDLCQPENVARVVRMALSGRTDVGQIAEATAKAVEETIRLERFCILSDKIASCRGAGTLKGNAPQSVLDHSHDDLPVRFRRREIRNLILQSKLQHKQKQFKKRPNSSYCEVPAHLYFEIVYKTFTNVTKKYSKVKYSKDVIARMFIGIIDNMGFEALSKTARKHYRKYAKREIYKYCSAT